MWLLALLTFREAWRKKVVLVAGALTLFFLILYGTGLHFILGDIVHQDPVAGSFFDMMEAILLFSMGVYLASFMVAGLAILAAAGSIAGEIENGTLYPLAVRPLLRRDLLLGKFFGLAAMLLTYAALFFLSMAGLIYWQTGLVVPGLLPALCLFILKPMVILSVTILGTTKFTTLGSGVFAFGLYILSVVGGMMEQIGALLGSTVIVYLGVVTNLIMPADAVYRRLVATVIDRIPAGNGHDFSFFNPQQILGPFGSQSTPSDWMLVYTLFYAVFMLTVAVNIFKKRDI